MNNIQTHTVICKVTGKESTVKFKFHVDGRTSPVFLESYCSERSVMLNVPKTCSCTELLKEIMRR